MTHQLKLIRGHQRFYTGILYERVRARAYIQRGVFAGDPL